MIVTLVSLVPVPPVAAIVIMVVKKWSCDAVVTTAETRKVAQLPLGRLHIARKIATEPEGVRDKIEREVEEVAEGRRLMPGKWEMGNEKCTRTAKSMVDRETRKMTTIQT
jgi:hypothetical protein